MKISFKKCVAICGKYPGPIGGTTILVQQMYDSLERSSKFIAKKIDLNYEGKNFAIKAVKTLYAIFRAIKTSDIAVFCVSKPGFEYLAFLFALTPIGKAQIIIRFFGGDSGRLLSRFPKKLGDIVLRRLGKKVTILTETKENIKTFQSFGMKVFQLTNSRKKIDVSSVEQKGSNAEKKLVFISQIKASKGIRDAICAVESLENVRLDVYGPLLWDISSNEFVGLKHVEYKGVLSLGSAQSVMKGYDALIFPTTYEGESHAGVIIEAYSVGLPVIAYAWSAIPEIVIHGKTGLLVSPKDVEGLTLAVKRLRDEPALQNRLSLGARRIFEEHFTDEASNTRFESILGCLGNPSVQNADVETIQLPDQMYF